MRIGGLATGMDIDSLVADLMKAEKQPLIKMEQNKIALEWKRDSYRETNKLLKELDDLIFSGISRASNLKSKSATSSNESIVTATASSSANEVTSTIKVNRLATSTTWVSNNTTALNQDFSAFAGQNITLNVTNGDGTAADPVQIQIEAGDTLDSVLNKLNQNTALGVSSFYDETNGKVVLSKMDQGSQSAIQIADATTADIFKQLGFVDAFAGGKLGEKDANLDGIADDANGNGDTLDESGVRIAGQDAEFEINGYLTTRSSNNFTINGVTYNLHSADSTKTATVQTSNNTEGVYDTIKAFVDKYNEVIESLNKKVSEKRNRDFPPLTPDQKKDMEEKEIELWEEKARSGLLRSDSSVSSALTSMRMGLYSQVEGADANFDILSEIGITTSKNFRDNGKLVIDEKKLKDAINNNSEEVYQIFNKQGATFATKGVATRLRDTISSTIKDIEKKAGNEYRGTTQYSLGREMNQVSDRISDFNRRLADIENRYWKQFGAMEKAISQYNTQFAALLSQTGGGY